MGFLQHLLEIRKQQGVVKAISSRGLRKKTRVGFGNAHDLNLRTVQRLGEEPVNMTVNESDDADAKGRV
jgi:hypothetical protein